MKIAIISPVFPPYRGGIGTAAYTEAEELALRGHDVSVFTPDYKKETPLFAKGGAEARFNLYLVRPVLKYGNAGFLPQLFWRLNKFDAVHLHYPFFGGAEVVWLWKLVLGRKKRLIITYHHDVVGSGGLGKFFSWHTKFIMPHIVKSADKIIVSSFDYAEHSNIEKIFRNTKEKFEEIPFGVDSIRFYSTKKNDELLKKHGIRVEEKVVLFIGGLDRAHYFKGVEFLIKSKIPAYAKAAAGRQIPNTKLLIVGDGDLRPYYEKLVEGLGVKSEVIFACPVSVDDLPSYYNLADVVVLPSVDKSEAFGIVLIEAMACGKPVIASNLVGVRSVVRDGFNGFLVQPKDEDDLAEKINNILSDEEKRVLFGQRSRKLVEEKYDTKIVAKRLEEELRNC